MAEWFAKSTNSSSTPFNKSLNNPENNTNIITELSASNYLAWIATFADEFDQIRTSTKRPFARLDGNYSRPFEQPMPNFVSYRIVSQALAHRAKCHLVLDEPAEALADLTLLHQLNLTLVKSGQSPLFITAMIHTAISGLYTDAVACGINSQIWREPELAALQKQLTEINLLPTVANSLRNERAGLCQALDVVSVAELSRMVISSSGPSKPVTDLGWRMLPRGWVYQNKAVIATLQQETIAAYNLTNQTITPHKIKAAAQHVERTFDHTTPWNFLAAVCLPNFSKASLSVARNQTSADQTQITCALERYRLAHGKYPDNLAALIPQFLGRIPSDIIAGSPMNYRRSSDEQNFKLWSIGWNEVDESGITIRGSDGKEDREVGDWVWQYPLL
jgi:hypothetical protein